MKYFLLIILIKINFYLKNIEIVINRKTIKMVFTKLKFNTKKQFLK